MKQKKGSLSECLESLNIDYTGRHGGHVDDNGEKVSSGNLSQYYAKLERNFAIVLASTWPSYHVSAIKDL